MSVNTYSFPPAYALLASNLEIDQPQDQAGENTADEPIAQREVTAAKIQNLDVFADKIYQDLFKDLETLDKVNIKGGEKLAVLDGTLTIQGSYLGQTLMRTIWNTVGYKYNRTDVSNRLKDIHKLAIKVFTELVLDPQSNEHHSEQAHFETLIKTAAQKVEDLRDHYQKKTPNDLLKSTLPGSADLFADFSQLATNPANHIANELLTPSDEVMTQERVNAFMGFVDSVKKGEMAGALQAVDCSNMLQNPVHNLSPNSAYMKNKLEGYLGEHIAEMVQIKNVIAAVAGIDECKRIILPSAVAVFKLENFFTDLLKSQGFSKCESENPNSHPIYERQ